VADEHERPEVQGFDHAGEVVGELVQVVRAGQCL
jgi:hypothetical protein